LQGNHDRWPQLQELAMSNDGLLHSPGAWPIFAEGDDLSGQDHDRLFVLDAAGTYKDVWLALGLDSRTVSRGIAVGDVYGDGRLSIAIARQWMPSIFLRNISSAGRAIVINLRTPGIAGDRPLIGGTAQIRLPNGRVVTAHADGGSGHSGKRSPEIHLGIGNVPEGQEFNVELAWRDQGGAHNASISLPPGRHRIVASNDGSLTVVPTGAMGGN
jgi:hypothetical protein